MNKNCFFKLFVVITTCLIVSVSCEKHNIVGGGDFYAINLSSNDTVKVVGGIGIQINSSHRLYAGTDDNIKLSFIPKDEYKGKIFDVTYSFSNKTERKGQGKDYSTTFKVNEFDVENQTLTITMSAQHESKNWLIQSLGHNIDIIIR